MKKKIIALLATIIIAIPILAIPAARVQPRWSLFSNATAVCSIPDDTYIVSVIAGQNVYKISMDIILYEKGLFTGYKEVSRISKTVNNYYNTTEGHYDYSASKDYKIELTATAFSTSGQTETISFYEEYT